MKATRTIRTRFVPATIDEPAHYVAENEFGDRIKVPFEKLCEKYEKTCVWDREAECHFVAQQLCKKIGWTGDFVTGLYRGEGFHVFLDREQAAATELLELLRTAVTRVEIANEEGDPILSAWLVDAKAAIKRAVG